MVYFNHSRQSKLAIQKKFSRVGIFLKLCLMILLIASLDWFASDTAHAQVTRIDSSDQPSDVFPVDLNLRAGPIVIGQACEFDYSGTQACRALREEGYRIVLVNSQSRKNRHQPAPRQ